MMYLFYSGYLSVQDFLMYLVYTAIDSGHLMCTTVLLYWAPGVIWTLRRAAFEGVPDLQLFPQLLYSLQHNASATS